MPQQKSASRLKRPDRINSKTFEKFIFNICLKTSKRIDTSRMAYEAAKEVEKHGATGITIGAKSFTAKQAKASMKMYEEFLELLNRILVESRNEKKNSVLT